MHDHVLIDDSVGHGERLEIEEIDVAALGAEEQVIAIRLEAHRRDLLQFALQRQRLGLDDRVLVDLPEMQGIVVAEGHHSTLGSIVLLFFNLFYGEDSFM